MGAALGIIGVAYAAQSATLTLQTNDSVPTALDVCNFSGAGRDEQNVAAFADGGGNDVYTYVAGDRANQGQTFTKGGNTNGYWVNSV